ncbi:MAG: chromosomal replication initiator protein DnaA [Anaerotardibacter sp.]
MDVNKVREELITQIKTLETVNASQIDAFFARIQVQAVSPGFIMLTSDTDFIKEWIETHYKKEIKEALKTLYGVDFEVLIEVDTTQKKDEGDQPIQSTQANTSFSPNPQSIPSNTARVNVTDLNTPTSTASSPTEVVSSLSSEMNTEVATQGVQNNSVNTINTPESMQVNANSTQEESAIPTFSTNNSDSVNPGLTSLTFENFVIGESNRFAYNMALDVAENPGTTSINPLFIWGRSGVGKTHLLCSIKNYINRQYPNFNVCYIDSMELVNKYGDAASEHSINKDSFKNFERFFEEFDVLLIDDIQSLQGKRETVNALFRIINNNIRRGKQLVFSADRAPKNIDLDERYTSRFSSGAVVDIQPPDDETKRNLIKSFIKQNEKDIGFQVKITDNALDYIVELSSPNVRELKSAILNVIYTLKLEGENELSRKKVNQVLGNHFITGGKKKITVDMVQKAVEQYYSVSHSDLIGKKRAQAITFPRQVAIYLCYQLVETTGSAIAKQFNRDHATAMYAKKVIEERIKDNRDLIEDVEVIKDLIKEQE